MSAVHGVFGGWTASDIVAPVQDIANLVMAIYGPPSELSLISQENITMMTDIKNFYGFATFLLFDFTGQPTDGPVDYGTCYGHLGATYGWNSLGAPRRGRPGGEGARAARAAPTDWRLSLLQDCG